MPTVYVGEQVDRDKQRKSTVQSSSRQSTAPSELLHHRLWSALIGSDDDVGSEIQDLSHHPSAIATALCIIA